MEAVAELVRERERAVPRAAEVREDERVGIGDLHRAVRAGDLAGARRRIDPTLVEEPLDDLPCLGRERGEGLDGQRARLVPVHRGDVFHDGREPVVVGKRRQPEEPSP